MAYTKELIEEVKLLYPDYKKMHKMAEDGDAFLGQYLYGSYPIGIHVDEVLSSISLEELQVKARLYKRMDRLYDEWCKQDPSKR